MKRDAGIGQGGCAIVLYADILVATNALIDFFLLLLCARLRHRTVRRGRLVLASAVGGASSLLILISGHAILCALCTLAAGAVLCLLTFGWRGTRALVWDLLCLFGVSFAYSAVMYALWFFVAPNGLYWHNGYTYFSISPLMLVGLTAAIYVLFCVIQLVLRRLRDSGGTVVRLRLTGNGTSIEGEALLDTGNLLTEPISGFPVIVADRALIAPVSLPLARFSQQPSEEEAARLAEHHFRFVHFRTISGGGLLPACQVEGVFSPDGALRGAEELYVAACAGLKQNTGYDAIIPRSAFCSIHLPAQPPASAGVHQERYDHHEQSVHFVVPEAAQPAYPKPKHGFIHKRRGYASCTADRRAGSRDHEPHSGGR